MRLIKIFVVPLAVIFCVGTASWAAFINDPAPDFSLPNMKREEISLADFRGEVVFVNFWASWCPPCKKEFPELNELANEYKGAGLKVLGVNLDKSQDRVEKFFEKIKIRPSTMIVLRDPDSSVVANYVARSMPSSFVIDKNMVIRFIHFGYRSEDPMKWREEVDFLRAEGKKN